MLILYLFVVGRKKCDETRLGCNNCQKLGLSCPGFPNPIDLMFKHETVRVANKANGLCKRRRSCKKRGDSDDIKNPKTPHSSSSESRYGSRRCSKTNAPLDDIDELKFEPKSNTPDIGEEWLQNWNPSASMTFNPSIEHQATSFFFENFVVASRSKLTSRGFLEVLIPMYQATTPNSPLAMAAEALAVRTAANYPGGTHLLHLADSLYGRALQSVQHAIHDPKQATSNEILLSILLFSVYESTTTSHIDNWSKHIQGAVSIVRSRGTSQFDDPQSLLLFRSTRTQMLTYAISRGEALEKFHGPKGWLSDQKDGETNCLIEYSIRLPGVLADAKKMLRLSQNPESIAKINELLRNAYTLQHELSSWELNMPSHFAYKTMEHSGPNDSASESEVVHSEVWQPGPVHVYQDVQIASIRNNNRVSQLLCSSVVIDSLKWLDLEGYTDDRRYKAASYRVRYLVDDIAASVPFHLGYRPDSEDKAHAKGKQKACKSCPIGPSMKLAT